MKLWAQGKLVEFRFTLLKRHDFINDGTGVNIAAVFAKLVWVDSCKSQNVFHTEIEQLGWRLQGVTASIKLLKEHQYLTLKVFALNWIWLDAY